MKTPLPSTARSCARALATVAPKTGTPAVRRRFINRSASGAQSGGGRRLQRRSGKQEVVGGAPPGHAVPGQEQERRAQPRAALLQPVERVDHLVARRVLWQTAALDVAVEHAALLVEQQRHVPGVL